MKALVDGLCSDLAERYVQYVETLMVDLWSDDGHIEFRCGFSLRRDHELRSVTLKIPAHLGRTDEERKLVVLAIFDEIEELIDEAIAEQRVLAN